MGKHITKRHPHAVGHWRSEQAWRQNTSLWTSAKLKPALFRANTLHNQLFSELPTVYRGKHVVLRYLRRIYLKANKLSKSEGTRKVEYAYHFWRCADAVYKNLSTLVRSCRNYSLPKLARFLKHSVVFNLVLYGRTCMKWLMFSRSERISERFLVPSTVRSVVWASNLVDLCASSTFTTDIVGFDTR